MAPRPYSNVEYLAMVQLYAISGFNTVEAKKLYESPDHLELLRSKGISNPKIPVPRTFLRVTQRLREYGQFNVPIYVATAKFKANKSGAAKPSSKPDKPSPKPRNGGLSLQSICTNASTNCCACIATLGEYVREIIRCFCAGKICESRFGEILCELISVTGNLCSDCVNFVKLLLGKICELKNKY